MSHGKSRLLHGVGHVVALPFFSIMHSIQWSGAQNVPRTGPVILAANHQSYYDPILIMLATSRPIVFLAWDRFFRFPVIGHFMRAYDALPVDVEAPEPSSFARLVRVLRGGGMCGIFPEGGRSPDGSLQRPQPGVGALALQTGAPVVPVAIHGAHRAWPPGRALPRPARIRLTFGKPMTFCAGPGRHSRERRTDVTRAVMEKIAEQLSIQAAGAGEGGSPIRDGPRIIEREL